MPDFVRHDVVQITVIEMELALSEVRLDVPSTHIVVHGRPREPLGDLVQRPVTTHAIGTVLGHRKDPRHVEHGGFPGGQRLGEIDLHHRFIHPARERQPLGRRAIGRGHDLFELRERVPALEAARPKA
jgi:hypothetical protein